MISMCILYHTNRDQQTLSDVEKEVKKLVYFLLAVIANQYTSPGAKPTIKGIHTGHPSIMLDISNNLDMYYLNHPSLIWYAFSYQI